MFPETELETESVDAPDESLRVRERAAVPFEIAVLPPAHPPGIDMDDIGGQAMTLDALEQGFDRGLVPISPARGQPQSERPRGNGRGPSRDRRVGGQDLLRPRTVKDVHLEGRGFRLERPRLEGRRSQVPGDPGARVDEESEAAAAPKKGNVLVRALAGRAESIERPGDDLLPGFVEPGEFFAEAVDPLAGEEMERGPDRPAAAWSRGEPERRDGRPPQSVDVAGIVGEEGVSVPVDESPAERFEAHLEGELGPGDEKTAFARLRREPHGAGLDRQDHGRRPGRS